MLYKTLRLSPPSGGGSDVAISFSIFPFFFLFSSTNWTFRIYSEMQPPSVFSLQPLQALLFSLPGPAREARPPWDGGHPRPPRGSRLGVPSSARPNQAVTTARSNAGPRSAVLAPPCFCYNFMHTIYYFSEALTDGFLFVWINFRLLFLPCNLFPLSCCFSSSCLFCFLLCILKTFLKCFMILGCALIFRSEAIKKPDWKDCVPARARGLPRWLGQRRICLQCRILGPGLKCGINSSYFFKRTLMKISLGFLCWAGQSLQISFSKDIVMLLFMFV